MARMSRTRTLLVAAGALATLAASAVAQSAMTTAMTYQGRLENNGVLFEGSIDVRLSTYNIPSGGAKTGATILRTTTCVGGLFTVEFDPDFSAFEANNDIYLEVEVRPTGSGPWTILPRQKLTASPFSASTRGLYVTGTTTSARVGIGGPAPAGFRFSIDESTNTAALVNIDSGNSQSQVSGFQLSDRGSAQWTFGKSAANNFYFDRANNLPLQVCIGIPSIVDDTDWSNELVLRGRDAATGAQGTSGIIFQNTNASWSWEMGQNKDGVLYFSQAGGPKNWISVPAIEIRGGSDIAEPYDVAPAGDTAAIPGMVVSIDPDSVGKLRVSSSSYDRMVAGIVSGANGVNAGLTLTQSGSVADGQLPIAKVGRVWCLVDADAAGAVTPGDLLTTSSTPGHAQKAADVARSQGCILGKAMSSLRSGRGYVLVLVGLQ